MFPGLIRSAGVFPVFVYLGRCDTTPYPKTIVANASCIIKFLAAAKNLARSLISVNRSTHVGPQTLTVRQTLRTEIGRAASLRGCNKPTLMRPRGTRSGSAACLAGETPAPWELFEPLSQTPGASSGLNAARRKEQTPAERSSAWPDSDRRRIGALSWVPRLCPERMPPVYRHPLPPRRHNQPERTKAR